MNLNAMDYGKGNEWEGLWSEGNERDGICSEGNEWDGLWFEESKIKCDDWSWWCNKRGGEVEWLWDDAMQANNRTKLSKPKAFLKLVEQYGFPNTNSDINSFPLYLFRWCLR